MKTETGHPLTDPLPTFLPLDILLLLLELLDAGTLSQLARTSRYFNSLIDTWWATYNRRHYRWSPSLSLARQIWTDRQEARFNHLSDRAWDQRSFETVMFDRPWAGKPHPVIALSESRLIVVAGQVASSYRFSPPNNTGGSTGIYHEGDSTIDSPLDRRRDVTGIAMLPDNGCNRTFVVSRADGKLARYSLKPSKEPSNEVPSPPSSCLHLSPTALYPHPASHITHITAHSNIILALAALKHQSDDGVKFEGLASVYNAKTPWIPPHSISLPHKPRSSLLSMEASTPFVAIGSALIGRSSAGGAVPVSGPLNIYPFSESRLHPVPLSKLSSGSQARTANAVYALSSASQGIASPFGSSPQIVLSGWFDGHVCVHDLRSNSRTDSTNEEAGSTLQTSGLKPVLSFEDVLLDTCVYSLGMGGGNGAKVVAGMGQHGILAIYDVRKAPRAPKNRSSTSSPDTRGWSVYSPGGNHTPVYALKVEGSRVWGATSRLFLFDFSPGGEGEGLRDSSMRTRCMTYFHRPSNMNTLTPHP